MDITETGRVELVALGGLLYEAADETANEGAANSDPGRCEKAHLVGAGKDGPGDETDEEADDDRPENMKH